jgi:hypothetical protein
MRCKYPDWEDDVYNWGSLKFIWGVKSYDDLTSADACLYTMNDIDICYDRDKNEYMLGVETAYCFKDSADAIKYLERLLEKFTEFMVSHNYPTNQLYMLWMSRPIICDTAKSIPELYTNFKFFVKGYKAMCGDEKGEIE